MMSDDEERHCEAVALREADERNYCLPEPEDVEWLADILARERASSRAQALDEIGSVFGDDCWCIPDGPDIDPCGPCLGRERIRALKGKP